MSTLLKHLLLSMLLLLPLSFANAGDANYGFNNHSFKGYMFYGAAIGMANANYEYVDGDQTYQIYDSPTLSLKIGRAWPSGVVAETRLNVGIDPLLGAFDQVNVSEAQFMLGYRLEVGHRLAFVPSIGYNRWKLSSRESVFNNPRDDRVTLTRGEGTVFQAALDYRAGSNHSFTLSHRVADIVDDYEMTSTTLSFNMLLP